MGFLRQPLPANKNISRCFAGVPLQPLPHPTHKPGKSPYNLPNAGKNHRQSKISQALPPKKQQQSPSPKSLPLIASKISPRRYIKIFINAKQLRSNKIKMKKVKKKFGGLKKAFTFAASK